MKEYMTAIGTATAALIQLIAVDTYDRVRLWFYKNPDADFAYWGKDTFLSNLATEDEKKVFVESHPEIDDLNDHTTVHIDDRYVIIKDFCPRLKEGVKEVYNKIGSEVQFIKKIAYKIEPDSDNYKIIAWPK